MKLTIQPHPSFRYAGAYLLRTNNVGYGVWCANNATAQTLRRQLTQCAPRAVDSPPVNLNQQTAKITSGPIGNFTVTIYNFDGSIDDAYDCQNLSTAKYLTRNFRC